MARQTRRRFLQVSGSVIGGIAAGTTVTAAERTDQFIVKTKGNEQPADLTVVHEMPGVNLAVVAGSEADVKASNAVKGYAADIELTLDSPTAEPREASTSDEGPADDPLSALQWDKDVQDVPAAHDVTTGEGTRVAVIDTGIDPDHPDLADPLNTDLSRNFTTDGGDHSPRFGEYHGTHVAGIVGAASNGTGIVGTAPATELVDCRVFGQGGGASFAAILAAIVYSANVGADVANLSLGAYPIPREGLGGFYGGVLNTAMTYANREGTLLVCAAGNDDAGLQHDGSFISIPNEGAQACSVSATTSVGYSPATGDAANPGTQPASYTNYGTNAITVGAPGGDVPKGGSAADLVYSAIPTEFAEAIGFTRPYAYLAGTSMAAPQVAGAAALMKAANPKLNSNQVESILKKTAEVPDGFEKRYYGAGLINVDDAVRNAKK